MSIKVTVRNYTFPITFSYNGWNVRLEKRIGFFKDVSVEAFFTPPTKPDLVFWCEKIPNQVQEFVIRSGLYPTKVSLKDMETYRNMARRYVNTINYPIAQSYRFSANGNLIDRFIGQNLSATQKVVDKVVDYMNHNLPKITELTIYEYINYLQRNGVNSQITSVLSQFPLRFML